MEQVQSILSLGRFYSNRTSAPAGWTSTTPLIHFTTPNPLPHQLRHSALAALQLQRTIDAATNAARQRQQQQQQLKRKIEQEAMSQRNFKMNNHTTNGTDMDTLMEDAPSTNGAGAGKKNQRAAAISGTTPTSHIASSLVPPPPLSSSSLLPRPTNRASTQISMNLSDDESSDDDDDDDDDYDK
jgi:hypothetical protein